MTPLHAENKSSNNKVRCAVSGLCSLKSRRKSKKQKSRNGLYVRLLRFATRCPSTHPSALILFYPHFVLPLMLADSRAYRHYESVFNKFFYDNGSCLDDLSYSEFFVTSRSRSRCFALFCIFVFPRCAAAKMREASHDWK
jgi:hypothetical protein